MSNELSNISDRLIWLEKTANQTTFELGRCLPAERGWALLPIAKITACRVLTIPVGTVSTVAYVAFFCLTTIGNLPLTAGAFAIRLIKYPFIHCCYPDPGQTNVSQPFSDYYSLVKHRWTFVSDNFNATIRNIAELYHGVKALFYGYTSSAIFTDEEINQMFDSQRLQALNDVVPSDIQIDNGTSYHFHKSMLRRTSAEPIVSIFSSENFEKTNEWVLDDVSDRVLLAFRNFVYFDFIQLDLPLSKELLLFSNGYGYTKLERFCADYLMKNINLSDVLTFAKDNELIFLQNMCFETIESDQTLLHLLDDLELQYSYTEFLKKQERSINLPLKRFEDDADVEISVGNSTIKAHKIILAARCPFLIENTIQKIDDKIFQISLLSDFKEQQVEDFLLYLYFKQLPDEKNEILLEKKEPFSFDRISNLIDVVRAVKDKDLLDYIAVKCQTKLFKILDLLEENENKKKINEQETQTYVSAVQTLADKLQLSPIVNLCVKMQLDRVTGPFKTSLVEPIKYLTHLDLSIFQISNKNLVLSFCNWIIKNPNNTPFLKTIHLNTEHKLPLKNYVKELLEKMPRLKEITTKDGKSFKP